MTRFTVFLFACLFSLAGTAQNLVPNPSFEFDSAAPPIQKYYWRRYVDWKKDSLTDHNQYVLTRSWSQPTGGTPDYLNSYRSSLFGFKTQTARTGRGRFGIVAGMTKNSFHSWLMEDGPYSEYLETKLLQPLEAGKTYCVRYYVSLDKRSHFVANNFGAMISSRSISQPDNRGTLDGDHSGEEYLANDNHYVTSEEGWTMICVTFTAKGGEQFLTIGSFMPSYAENRHRVDPKAHRSLRWMPECKYAYYYLDDVSLEEVKPGEPLCGAPKDSVARNNIVILVDVSGSMEQKKYIDSMEVATMNFVNTLNPTDLISIIAFRSDTQTLVNAHPARDTAFIHEAFRHVNKGGATNVGLALEAAYAQVRRNLLNPGNNKIILITDGKIHIAKAMQENMVKSANSEGIEFSILFLGEKVPEDMAALATELNGTAVAAPPSGADDFMQSQAPANAVETPYGTSKPAKIVVWHVLTKVFFPVILVGMALYKLTTL